VKYKFNEVEKLKIDNMLLNQKLIQIRFERLLDSIAIGNNLGPKEKVTLLPDYSGFSVEEKEECQEPSLDGGCEDSNDDV